MIAQVDNRNYDDVSKYIVMGLNFESRRFNHNIICSYTCCVFEQAR